MSESGPSRRLPAAVLALLTIASAAGLLCTRITDYDDSILLVGARLVHAGRLPYRDFYTHYGPLGFSIQSALSGTIGNPPLALRVGQALGLGLLCALAFGAACRVGRRGTEAWVAVLFSLALSPAALLPSFYGFALTLAALGAFALAQNVPSPRATSSWAALSGVLLAAAALVRPAFAAYALAAIVCVGILLAEPARRRRTLLVFALALAAAGAALWALLYVRLRPAEVFEATVLLPQRVLAGGRRYRQAPFLDAPLPLAFLFTSLFATVPLIWSTALPSRRSRALAVAGIVLGGALPLWLRVSGRPERDAALIALAAPAIAAALLLLQRAALLRNPALRAAALFGVAAAAFEHYLWARADRPHCLLFLIVGTAGAALTARELGAVGRSVLAAFFLFAAFVFLRAPDRVLAPLESLWHGGAATVARGLRTPHASWTSLWPCGQVPADAARAAALADRNADPASRFVAVASNQSLTDQNPVLLFLLSSRLPYTRWYQYDPGVQSSPPVQEQMIEELERSGSRTAVVWFSEAYTGGETPGATPARTPFDDAFDRMFPVRGPRVGGYEIRLRAGD